MIATGIGGKAQCPRDLRNRARPRSASVSSVNASGVFAEAVKMCRGRSVLARGGCDCNSAARLRSAHAHWCRRIRTNSRRQCAFLPATASASVTTRIGSLSQSRCGLSFLTCRLAGIWPCCIARMTLITPQMPAAHSRCPTLDLTEPISSGRERSAWIVGERADLDRIADRGAGAVRFDISDVRRLQARHCPARDGSAPAARDRSAR